MLDSEAYRTVLCRPYTLNPKVLPSHGEYRGLNNCRRFGLGGVGLWFEGHWGLGVQGFGVQSRVVETRRHGGLWMRSLGFSSGVRCV